MLNVVTGLVFVLLLFSLLGTTVMELISSLLSLRGRNLERALQRILYSSKKGELFKTFTNNVQYKQIQSKFFLWNRPPSYMSSKTFSSILWSMLFKQKGMEAQNVEQTILSLKNEQFSKALHQIYIDSGSDVFLFRNNVEAWYDQVMERSSGWFKRNTQFLLVVVGLFIAIIFNVDTISIYEKLSTDPEASLKLIQFTDTYLDSPQAHGLSSAQLSQLQQQSTSILYQNIDAIGNQVGMGWNDFTELPESTKDWLYRILGWLTTTLAISLGAPFWFDVLKNIVNVRGSGGVPSRTQYQVPQTSSSTQIPKNIPQSYD